MKNMKVCAPGTASPVFESKMYVHSSVPSRKRKEQREFASTVSNMIRCFKGKICHHLLISSKLQYLHCEASTVSRVCRVHTIHECARFDHVL